MLGKLFQAIEDSGRLYNPFYNISKTLILKSDENSILKDFCIQFKLS